MPKNFSKKTKTSSSKKILAGVSLAGSLLLTPGSQKPISLLDKPPALRASLGLVSQKELQTLLQHLLKNALPQSSRLLTRQEEKSLQQIIHKTLGLKAVVELDGNRLNHQIGWMGLEQHLMRYPGDRSLTNRSFPQVGIAPAKGAWGYWASSRTKLASTDIRMEKYYIAVQTLYLPDWQKRLKDLRDWYKYRKVLVINPDNGSAVVAIIGDAGPAKWTGKQFGGSPQVMHDLGFYPYATKGKTIVLFLSDPDNKIPLGPITQPLTAPPAQSI